MVLDLLSNVFGKSKKSNGKSSDKDESNASDKSNNLYPTILLTDQMLKGESDTPPFEIVNIESSSSNKTPFKTNDSVIVSSNSRQKAFSPLDNIPFHITSNGETHEDSLNDLNECFTLLNSVANCLVNPTYEYKFSTESMIINSFQVDSKPWS